MLGLCGLQEAVPRASKINEDEEVNDLTKLEGGCHIITKEKRKKTCPAWEETKDKVNQLVTPCGEVCGHKEGIALGNSGWTALPVLDSYRSSPPILIPSGYQSGRSDPGGLGGFNRNTGQPGGFAAENSAACVHGPKTHGIDKLFSL